MLHSAVLGAIAPVLGGVAPGGWFSRFGFTWLSGVVLMTAGFQTLVDVIAPPDVAALSTGRLERLLGAQDDGGQLTVELMGRQDGDAVALRVAGCTDEAVELTRHGVRFPVEVEGIDADETCVLQARRRDGRFWTAWTEPVKVQGADTVGLALPDYRAAGVGLLVSRRFQGAYVDDVERHSPAERAGIEPGDMISHVDGRALAGLGIDEMVEAITGPEGTNPELSLIDVRTGRTVHRTVDREYMRSTSFRY